MVNHSIGLLPQPPRDGSGRRRYAGKEVIQVVRVARLPAAGSPDEPDALPVGVVSS